MQSSRKKIRTKKRQIVRYLKGTKFKTRIYIGLLASLLIAALFATTTALYSQMSQQSKNQNLPQITIPKNQVQRGLIFDSLTRAQEQDPCDKLYKLPNSAATAARRAIQEACTHGPDSAPKGVDVMQDAPLAVPGSGNTSLSIDYAPPVYCAGDGTSGPRTQVIYAVASNQRDRYDDVLPTIKALAGLAGKDINDSALKTGGTRQVKWVTSPDCQLDIKKVILAPDGDDNFSNTVRDLTNQGYINNDRKYLVFTDANVYCGIAEMYLDDRPTADNLNNRGSLIARVDSGCWREISTTHELVHTLGAVQNSAPHSSGLGHCTDFFEVMCYDDGSGITASILCVGPNDYYWLDCQEDDYFNMRPPAGSYLATHWNLVNNRFLSDGSDATTPPPNTPSLDTTSPRITITSPVNGAVVSGVVGFIANATDNVAVTKVEFLLDGIVKASFSSLNSVGWNWNTTVADDGMHTLTARAHDGAGNIGIATSTFTVKNSTSTTPPNPGGSQPTTNSFSGTLNNKTTSATYSLNLTKGSIQASLDPPQNNKSAWKLELQTASGVVLQSTSGTNTLSISTNIDSGGYKLVVSAGKGRFTLTVHTQPTVTLRSVDKLGERTKTSFIDKAYSFIGRLFR
jgi:hypothetical protein